VDAWRAIYQAEDAVAKAKGKNLDQARNLATEAPREIGAEVR
jgi:hypothetical protein